MWFVVVFALAAVFGLGLLVGCRISKSRPKLDGHLVITETDGKTLMSFDFDNEEKIVELRNKQVISFGVVGPERITIDEAS